MAASVDELQARLNELEERLARHEERTEPMSAEVMYSTAKEWIDNNPAVWSAAKTMARSRAKFGKRVSMKRIIEDLRDEFGMAWQTEEFKLSNSVTSCLARFLVQECPEVKPYIQFKRSKVDRFFK
jgi:hypothetical protein